jgi:C4-dicarboxylate-specific signal transduction histidine kinase
MGAITRQLKSYARKGGEAFEPVDVKAAMSSALSMMEPQLKSRVVTHHPYPAAWPGVMVWLTACGWNR